MLGSFQFQGTVLNPISQVQLNESTFTRHKTQFCWSFNFSHFALSPCLNLPPVIGALCLLRKIVLSEFIVRAFSSLRWSCTWHRMLCNFPLPPPLHCHCVQIIIVFKYQFHVIERKTVRIYNFVFETFCSRNFLSSRTPRSKGDGWEECCANMYTFQLEVTFIKHHNSPTSFNTNKWQT